jgi:predicted RNA-binding protein with EMAP domain
MGTETKFKNGTLYISYKENIPEDRQKIIKIYKENSFIFAKVIKNLKNIDLKLFNILYYYIQKEVRQHNEPPLFDIKITIEQKVLKEKLNLTSKEWKRDLLSSIKRLHKKHITLKDYRHPYSGDLIKWADINIISSPKLVKPNKTGRNDIFIFTISDIVVISTWRKIRYTHLDLNKILNFTSIHSIKFYEYLTAIIQYYQNKNQYKQEINFSFLELKEIFESNEKYLSNLVNKTFKKKVYDEVSKIIPFRYEVFSKDKIITIYLEEILL